MAPGLRLHRPGRRLRQLLPSETCVATWTRISPGQVPGRLWCRLCAGAPFTAKLSGMSATQNKGSEASGRPLRSSARGRKIPATEFPSGGGPGDLGLAPFLMSVQVKHDRTDIFSLSATISMFFCFFFKRRSDISSQQVCQNNHVFKCSQ